jgi:hypothetical protein
MATRQGSSAVRYPRFTQFRHRTLRIMRRAWTWAVHQAKRLPEHRARGSRAARRATLLVAVFCSVVFAVLIAFGAYLVLHWLLPAGAHPIQPKDLTQFALTIVAGIGGVVALVVAYRRQRGIEESRFVERFGAASSQLGNSDVAVRLAGVYAMAGVADEASGPERQQCVDVLVAYPTPRSLGATTKPNSRKRCRPERI